MRAKWPSSGIICRSSFANHLAVCSVEATCLCPSAPSRWHRRRPAACSSRRAWRALRLAWNTPSVPMVPCATTPFPSLEQVRKHSVVHDGQPLRRIGDDEFHFERVGDALKRSRLDHAADAKRPALRRFLRDHLRWCEEEHEVGLERVQHQHRRKAQQGRAGGNPRETAMARLHCPAFVAVSSSGSAGTRGAVRATPGVRR